MSDADEWEDDYGNKILLNGQPSRSDSDSYVKKMVDSTIEVLNEALKETKSEDKVDPRMQGTVPKPVSLNDRFIVKPYAGDRTLKAKVSNGFAMVQQKTSIVGLELLMEARLSTTNKDLLEIFPKGSMIYVKEELLFTQVWAKAIYESDAVEGNFIIVDVNNIEFIKRTC